ncbi:Riboflavin biosynthesis protein PYRD, chloroplastic [Dichanthelium oligosanthes]|uniref:Riboflavin biosynthesis protein PYRD, chloroplastic n=1 Tax=Dichanthelium oligosanthes TaxID=888268 RepID=A0A1E5WJJ6_9POAL|nr:Riboflavin biosynthesis protein PYRD, chloroplastic [Dichanthelium oligosanthes]
MASSLVSRPHLTPRPVRAATLASPSFARIAAGGLGGRRVAAGLRCQAQAAGDLDGHYMRRCVELARKAAGHTSPNPMVGCVIVRDGQVVGEGFHPKAGQPHAEVFALRDAGDLAENATAYVSLEPCNHYGRTPPCTEALINAKVKEVVVGMTDPNPIVASKGIEKLQGAGIDVRVGVEEALCRRLNEAYIHRMLTGKAFATLRATLSANGIVTNQIGKGADQSGGYYSQLMKEYDGVIISSDLAKMSTLLVSHEAGANQPQYIIIAQGESSQLHIPSLSKEHASKAIVLADSPVTVEPAGVEVAVLRQIDLDSILQLLAQRGLCSVLVDFREAGESFAALLNDFQEDKLVQKVVLEVLPVWLASEGLSNLAFGGGQSFLLKNVEYKEVNGSLLLEGYV